MNFNPYFFSSTVAVCKPCVCVLLQCYDYEPSMGHGHEVAAERGAEGAEGTRAAARVTLDNHSHTASPNWLPAGLLKPHR